MRTCDSFPLKQIRFVNKSALFCEKGLSELNNLVHEDAALVVLGLNMALHELFLMFRKAGESHRMVMLNQLFFWQGVDIPPTRRP
jgi:hypothetical protein